MEKAKKYIKNAILLISVFLLWHMAVKGIFGISDYDDMGFFYGLAGTILTVYFYGKGKQI